MRAWKEFEALLPKAGKIIQCQALLKLDRADMTYRKNKTYIGPMSPIGPIRPMFPDLLAPVALLRAHRGKQSEGRAALSLPRYEQ